MSNRKYPAPRKSKYDPETFELVDSVEHLYRLSLARRSVYIDHNGWGQLLPAATIMNWQASGLMKMIMLGNLKIYPKPNEKELLK